MLLDLKVASSRLWSTSFLVALTKARRALVEASDAAKSLSAAEPAQHGQHLLTLIERDGMQAHNAPADHIPDIWNVHFDLLADVCDDGQDPV